MNTANHNYLYAIEFLLFTKYKCNVSIVKQIKTCRLISTYTYIQKNYRHSTELCFEKRAVTKKLAILGQTKIST